VKPHEHVNETASCRCAGASSLQDRLEAGTQATVELDMPSTGREVTDHRAANLLSDRIEDVPIARAQALIPSDPAQVEAK
jgi:hypothetical protein